MVGPPRLNETRGQGPLTLRSDERGIRMDNYFIVKQEDTIDRLKAADIPFCNMIISETWGIVIDSDKLPQVLEALNVRETNRGPTPYDGVVHLIVEDIPVEQPVVEVVSTVPGELLARMEDPLITVDEELPVEDIIREIEGEVPGMVTTTMPTPVKKRRTTKAATPTPTVVVETPTVPEPPPVDLSKLKINMSDGGSSDLRAPEPIKTAIREILLPFIKTSVTVLNPHMQHKAPVDSASGFLIYLWSSPSGAPVEYTPPTMWDIPVDCRDYSFSFSEVGIPILTSEGNCVAELIGERHLYIHHDLFDAGSSNEIKIFRKLLEQVCIELAAPVDDRQLRREAMAKREEAANIQHLAVGCRTLVDRSIEHYKAAIKNSQERRDSFIKEATAEARKVSNAHCALSGIEESKNDMVKKVEGEYKKILGIDRVTKVRATTTCLKVYVNTMYCTDPRTSIVHEIGKFRIEVYLEGGRGGIKFFNIDKTTEGYRSRMQAPHVFENGSPCLGNLEEVIPELICGMELAALVMVGMRFLESVNVDDAAGKHIDKWPKAKVQPAKESAGTEAEANVPT